MHFGHVATRGGPILFAQRGTRRVAIRDHVEGVGSLDELIALQPAGWRERLKLALDDPTAKAPPAGQLVQPLFRPGNVIAIGLNYHDHCREFGADPPATPMIFAKQRRDRPGRSDSMVVGDD